MKTFTIDETNTIAIHASVQEAEAVANAERFRNEATLAKLAADWPMARLVEIWNSLPGITTISKFKDRATAVSRIWKAIQVLGDAAPAATSQPEAKPVVEVAQDGATDLESTVIEPVAEQAVAPLEAETVIAEVAEADVDTPVGAQTPDVAPVERSAKNKATRAKKAPVTATNVGAPREGSKTSQVIAMLKREGGTTLEEIMRMMGWQKHTTRAMLSAGGSLTKNHGVIVTSEKVGDHRRYSIKA